MWIVEVSVILVENVKIVIFSFRHLTGTTNDKVKLDVGHRIRYPRITDVAQIQW